MLLSLAIPNELLMFGSPVLGLFALVPLYYAFSLVTTAKEASICLAIQFSLTHLLSSFWLVFFKDFALLTLGLTTLCYLVAGAILGLAFWYPYSRKPLNGSSSGFSSTERVLWFTVCWTLHEWIKSTGFLAYPWGTTIQTAWQWKLLTQIVSVTGTWGISLLFSLFSAVVGECIIQLPSGKKNAGLARTASFCIFLFALTTLYGIREYTRSRQPETVMDIIMVQQNGDSWVDDPNTLIRRSQRLTAEQLAASPEKPDLVVWSETVLNYLLPDYWDWYDRNPSGAPLQQSIRDTAVPYIIGAPWNYNREKEQYQNAAVLFDADASIVKHHGKIHLVPFAESIPYADKPWMQFLMETVAGFSSSWTSGTEYTIFDIPLKSGRTAHISTPICFEDAFPDVCRQLFLNGSQVFINITNDSWSETKSAEVQHFVMASYRAQEFRTTMVRSTNAGYSAVIDPSGSVIAELPLFEAASLRVNVPVYEQVMTPYAVFGDWLPLVCLLVMVYLLVLAIRNSKNNL